MNLNKNYDTKLDDFGFHFEWEKDCARQLFIITVSILRWIPTILYFSFSNVPSWQGDHNSFEIVVYLLANSKVKQINQSLGESKRNESNRISHLESHSQCGHVPAR